MGFVTIGSKLRSGNNPLTLEIAVSKFRVCPDRSVRTIRCQPMAVALVFLERAAAVGKTSTGVLESTGHIPPNSPSVPG